VRSRYHEAYDLSMCYTGAKMECLYGVQYEEEMTCMHYTNMALCLMLLLSLSAGHTSAATTAPATSPKTISLDVQGRSRT
jgi:hypothetical protein